MSVSRRDTPDDWTMCPLGSLLREVDVRLSDLPQLQREGIEVLSLTKRFGLIPQSERFDKRVATEDVDKYKVVRRGWIVYNPYVIWEGAIHALRRDMPGIVSPVYAVWERTENDGGFLDHILRTPELVAEYERFSAGAVNRRRSIKKEGFASIEVALPPLAEQRKIAGLLGIMRRAVQRHERLIALTAELKKALMHKLFSEGTRGEPLKANRFGMSPVSWPIVPLGECCEVQTGIAKGRAVRPEDALTVPYLRVANVQDGHLNLDEMKMITIRKAEFARFSLRIGDVVLTEGGDLDKLGRGFIWNGEVAKCVHQNHVFSVRPNLSKLSSEFIAYQTQSPYGKAYFLSVAHKTTNLACINTSKLKAFPVLLPNKEEQKEIVCILQSLDHRRDVTAKVLLSMRSLFRTLLHQLTTAQVRVCDLDLSALDEPETEVAGVT